MGFLTRMTIGGNVQGSGAGGVDWDQYAQGQLKTQDMPPDYVEPSPAGDDRPSAPPAPKEALEAAPDFKFYSQWARPGFLPGWKGSDYLEYARGLLPQIARNFEEAGRAARHAEGQIVQNFPVWADAVLERYDWLVHTVIAGVEKGMPAKDAMELIVAAQRYLVGLPTLIGLAMGTAARIGVQIGFEIGWGEGYKARDEETNDLVAWLKRLLEKAAPYFGAALGLILGGVALAALLAFRR